MHVLIIGSGVPSEKYPLNGGFAFGQAKELAIAGCDVTYFAIDLRSFRRRRPWGIKNGYESKGLKWYFISVPIGAIPIKYLCKIGSWALSLLYNRVYKNTRPDIIHAHFMELGCMASYLAKKRNIPLVITEHSSVMNRAIISKDVKECAQKGYSQASTVIAVSHKLANNIKEKIGIECVVVPNMIKSEIFSHVQRKKHTGFRIVTTSNLIYLKRTINLIKAVESIHSTYNNICLDIIGDGPLKEELMQYVENNGLNDFIKFHGYLSSQAIAQVYTEADCFALVSTTETFGVVWVEAMMAGLPVIATRCGGPEDFVNESNGLLIDVDNQEQLCKAIEYMHNNSSQYDSELLKSFAKDNFSPDKVAQKIIKIYNDIV